MAIDRSTITRGLSVAGIAAVVGLLSAILTLYAQGSSIIKEIVIERIKKDFAPVGTVVSSLLEPNDFARAIGEEEGAVITSRTWVLADGRDVTGTIYAVTTHRVKVPDLGGLFLRGIDPNGPLRNPGSIEDWSTGNPKNPFKGTSDSKGQSYTFNQFVYGVDNYDVPGGPVRRPYPAPMSIDTTHTHLITVDGGGDAETRPKNAAVFYYIKIN